MVSHLVLSNMFSEGKLKDLRSPFPLGQPTELDDRDFLDASNLEDVEDDTDIKIPGAIPENTRSPLDSPVFGSGFTSLFSPHVYQLGSMGSVSPARATQSMDPGTHLGKIVVIYDISFVTYVPIILGI